MPRLHEYREYINAHYYDCVSLSPYDGDAGGHNSASLSRSGYARLFGNMNVGDRLRSNMQIGEQLTGATSWLVRNWYAHTNIPGIPEFWTWAASAFATLTIGMKPYWRLPLPHLFARREDTSSPPNEEEQRALAIQADQRSADLAAELWSAHGAHPKGAFDALLSAERGPWLQAAARALSRLERNDYLLVPVRQCFSITIESDHAAYSALMQALEKYEHKVEPGPRVWLHLQGWTTRDVQ